MPYHLFNAGDWRIVFKCAEDWCDIFAGSWMKAIRLSSNLILRSLASGEKVQEGMILVYDDSEGGERKLSSGAFGMASQLVLYPESKIGIVLLANDGGFSTRKSLALWRKFARLTGLNKRFAITSAPSYPVERLPGLCVWAEA